MVLLAKVAPVPFFSGFTRKYVSANTLIPECIAIIQARKQIVLIAVPKEALPDCHLDLML